MEKKGWLDTVKTATSNHAQLRTLTGETPPEEPNRLSVNSGGAKVVINEELKFFGKGQQEIWLVSSDSIWGDTSNAAPFQ